MSDRPAIEFFTTDELIPELRSRASASIISLIPLNSPSTVIQRFAGCRMTLLGLAVQSQCDIAAACSNPPPPRTEDADHE